MKRINLLIGAVLLMGIGMIISKVFGMERVSEIMRALFFPLFALLYFLKKSFKSIFFSGFVVCFALGEFSYIVNVQDWPNSYYFGSASLLLAYLFMLCFILRKFNFKRLIKKFPLHILVLICVGVYVFLELDKTIGFNINSSESLLDYVIESTYNVMIICVFAMAFLYYLYFDSKPSLTFFLAFVFIALSEMLQIGYIFISSDSALSISYSLFLILGFYFLFRFIGGQEQEALQLT